MQNSGYGYVPPPRRSCTPLTILGVACGGCALIAIAVAIAVGVFGYRIMGEVTKPGVPPPPAYVGVWQSKDGSETLTIGADGHGSYKGYTQTNYGHTNLSVDGG